MMLAFYCIHGKPGYPASWIFAETLRGPGVVRSAILYVSLFDQSSENETFLLPGLLIATSVALINDEKPICAW